MTPMIEAAAWALAAPCAALMGFAIQRGATCTVAAVDELLHQRRAARLLALLEAALWVGGGLLLARHLQWLPVLPTGFALSAWTVAGAALLGLGAYVNRACVFGAIARLGSGEWAYAATPLGFYLGCASVALLLPRHSPQALPPGSPVLLAAPAELALLFLAFVAWRMARPLWRPTRTLLGRQLLGGHWPPHMATTVIGLTFLLMLLLVGAWAYTDVLAELAQGMAGSLLARGVLLLCLLAGAVLGGWTAGRFQRRPLRWQDALRCAAGGVLMGWGSLTIPGGNDGLILLGMPLLWPYAWVAFLTMCVSIALPMWALGRRAAARTG